MNIIIGPSYQWEKRDGITQGDNGLGQHEDPCIILYLPVFTVFICGTRSFLVQLIDVCDKAP